MQQRERPYADAREQPCRARFEPRRRICAGTHKGHHGRQLKRSLWVVIPGIGLVLLFRCLKIKVPKLGGPETRPQRHSGPADCQPVSSDIYRRPDPLIYDQYYLMAQGIAVSWDNPDIHVEQNGQ